MSDPMADYYNGMGLQGMTGPNPYLEFSGQIPLAGYAGVPHDAQGKLIASYAPPAAPPMGTTLNSPPPPAASQNGAFSPQQAMRLMSTGGMPTPSGNGMGPVNDQANLDTYNQLTAGYQQAPQQTSQQMGSQTQAQVANAAAQRQAYLQAMANPGPLPTYGAQMQPGARPTGAPQPSVLAQFLAAHPSGGTTGAGGYSNQSFFNTLNALQAQKGAGT
jgi:hypothetical protein